MIFFSIMFFCFGVFGIITLGYVVANNFPKIGHYFGIVTAVWIEDLEDGKLIITIMKKHPDGSSYVIVPYERVVKLKDNGQCETSGYHKYKWIKYEGPKL